MLLFQPVLPAPAPSLFLVTLKEALRLSREVLVADARLLRGLRPTPLGFEAAEASPEAYLNLRPYAPPRAVRAAGGYVVRRTGGGTEVLLIFRRGVWDLPKGKCHGGEGARACGQREVGEEIGAADVEILDALGQTVHGYLEQGRYVVKKTRWFLMQTEQQRFTPQAEEDITDVEWVPWDEAGERLQFDTLRAHHHLVTPIVTSAFR